MAAEALTEAAVVARRQHLAVGIGVGPRTVTCGLGEGLEPNLVARLLEECWSVRGLVGGLWVFLGARPLERVPASIALGPVVSVGMSRPAAALTISAWDVLKYV